MLKQTNSANLKGGVASEPPVANGLEEVIKILRHKGTKFLSYYGLEKILFRLHHVNNFSLFTSHFSPKKAAFTLAEVLITVGVIGVVAAITMPTVVSNYQKKVWTTQLQRNYNLIDNAITKYLADQRVETLVESDLSLDNDGSYTNLENFAKNYLGVVKDCHTYYWSNQYGNCFGRVYKRLNGTFENSATTAGANSAHVCNYTALLKTGAAICLDFVAMETVDNDDGSQSNSSNNTISENSLIIEIDVNGEKGPNQLGRDMFQMNVSKNDNRIFDYQYEKEGGGFDMNNEFIGNGSFGKIMADGWKMNY